MGNQVTKHYMRATTQSLLTFARNKINCNQTAAGNSSTHEVIARNHGVGISSDMNMEFGTSWDWRISNNTINGGTFDRNDYRGDLIQARDIEMWILSVARVLSRVRRVHMVKTLTQHFSGNGPRRWSGTWVPAYYTYGFYRNTQADGNYSAPNLSWVRQRLNPNLDILQSTWDQIIAEVQATISRNFDRQVHTVNYCHYSCHSSCHSSRGRR